MRQSTHDEIQSAADNFIVQLIDREWKIGQCDNQIVILYLALHNKVHYLPVECSGDIDLSDYHFYINVTHTTSFVSLT